MPTFKTYCSLLVMMCLHHVMNTWNTFYFMDKEIWKPIPNYEGFYEVSNIGNVRSVTRTVWQLYKFNTLKGNTKRQAVGKDGYMVVSLCKGGKPKVFQVHRLVAKAFIPNPKSLPCVNHINEIKTDNRMENLEWCTVIYNNNYGEGAKKRIVSMRKTTGKAINQYSMEGVFIKRYECLGDVKKDGFSLSNISLCCRGLRKSGQARGFKWSFADDKYGLAFTPRPYDGTSDHHTQEKSLERKFDPQSEVVANNSNNNSDKPMQLSLF